MQRTWARRCWALLNVRYVVTEGTIANDDYALVYEGEVRIYENTDVLPRAFAFVAWTAHPRP